MIIRRVQWIERNEEKVALNGLSVDEVESVLLNPSAVQSFSRSTGRPMVFGWTHTGRHIAVVYEVLVEEEGYVYPNTAYETPPPRRIGKRSKP